MRVELSYEEKILNALSGIKHRRGASVIERNIAEFTAIRNVLQPLYDEVNRLNGNEGSS